MVLHCGKCPMYLSYEEGEENIFFGDCTLFYAISESRRKDPFPLYLFAKGQCMFSLPQNYDFNQLRNGETILDVIKKVTDGFEYEVDLGNINLNDIDMPKILERIV